MTQDGPFEIFLVGPPGLETLLADEARAAGFALARAVPGGVTLSGGWPEVWRANLALRGPTRVLVRIGAFRALHLAQLDKRARKFPWGDFLAPDVPVRVEATCRASRIYHAGAAAQRIETALREELGAPIGAEGVRVLARIEDDLVTLSLDATGESLHKRGHKLAVGKAPLRETLAALFLRACGYQGDEPVVDPMCGSGTFVLEAAEIAAGLAPGRTRGFDFERMACLDASAWAAMKAEVRPGVPGVRFHGFDRDQGAIQMAGQNAARAGVADWVAFGRQPISELAPPEGPAGLVMVNPPYGGRIGEKVPLHGLYGALGAVLRKRFAGWRVGIVTSEAGLARATGLSFGPPGPPVDHGGLKIRLYSTGALG
jgi:putative N6-adenine-specific DNA methylase